MMAKGKKVIMPSYYAVLLSGSHVTELCCHVNMQHLSFFNLKNVSYIWFLIATINHSCIYICNVDVIVSFGVQTLF